MIRAIAVDDEPPALKIIEHFCNESGRINLQKTFTRPDEAMRFLDQFPVDLIFLDIQMPSLSGIDFLRGMQHKPQVIITSAFSQYAIEGFNLNVTDFLLKPFSYERFLKAIEKAAQAIIQKDPHSPEKDCIYIRADYSLVKIAFPEITLIEGLDDYIKIHIAGKRTLVTRMTMKGILSLLPGGGFIRVHRSFIVPVAKVERLRNKIIRVAGRDVPLGKSYEADFHRFFGTGEKGSMDGTTPDLMAE